MTRRERKARHAAYLERAAYTLTEEYQTLSLLWRTAGRIEYQRDMARVIRDNPERFDELRRLPPLRLVEDVYSVRVSA